MPCKIKGRPIKIERWSGRGWEVVADSASIRGAKITAAHQSRLDACFYRVWDEREILRFDHGIATSREPRRRGTSPIERMIDSATGFQEPT